MASSQEAAAPAAAGPPAAEPLDEQRQAGPVDGGRLDDADAHRRLVAAQELAASTSEAASERAPMEGQLPGARRSSAAAVGVDELDIRIDLRDAAAASSRPRSSFDVR